MDEVLIKVRQKLCRKSDVSWPTYFLVCLFGLGSWVAVNGVWVELPVLVQHAPELWKLPSIFAVAIQIANIGPLAHTIFNAFFPGKIKDSAVIYVIYIIGIVATVLLAFLWDRTGYISGKKHSVALIALVFFVATVACTSSVTFLPYMADFRSDYMSALFVGGGLSALIPSLLAIGQGINTDGGCSNSSSSGESDLNFGVNGFFFGLTAMTVVSLCAFVALNYLGFALRERLSFQTELNEMPREAMALDRSQEFELENFNETQITSDTTSNQHSEDQQYQLAFMLFIQLWVHALSNGLVPSLQSYACIPYGYKVYHLALTLSNIANPLSSLLFYWFPTKSILFVCLSSVVYTSLVSYVLCAAALSATPPLPEKNVGASIIVIVNVVAVALVTYIKVAISIWMQDKGQKYLRWAGIALQTGSFIGALVIFFPVNVSNSFTQPSPC